MRLWPTIYRGIVVFLCFLSTFSRNNKHFPLNFLSLILYIMWTVSCFVLLNYKTMWDYEVEKINPILMHD